MTKSTSPKAVPAAANPANLENEAAVVAVAEPTPEKINTTAKVTATVVTPEVVADASPAASTVAAKKTAKAKAVKATKEKKIVIKKPKLVRDSFTFPESDYALIRVLKQRALAAGCDVKKTEVLRAALTVISELSDQDLVTALNRIDKLKPGRPAK